MISFFHSFVNVFIYNVREKNFRSNAKKIICFRNSKHSMDVSKGKDSGNKQAIQLSSKPTESTGVANSNGSHMQSH